MGVNGSVVTLFLHGSGFSELSVSCREGSGCVSCDTHRQGLTRCGAVVVLILFEFMFNHQ